MRTMGILEELWICFVKLTGFASGSGLIRCDFRLEASTGDDGQCHALLWSPFVDDEARPGHFAEGS